MLTKLANRPNLKVIATVAGIAAVFGTLVSLSTEYRNDCIKAGGKDAVERCWERSLQINGMGEGGPLSAAVLVGYIIGAYNKEKEKQEKYEEGYWTLNPDLRSGDDELG